MAIEIEDGILIRVTDADILADGKFIIPPGVTKIGAGAFNSCTSLTSITIPPGVPKIDDYTFLGCESLTSIIIPPGVTEIGADAFRGCRNLTTIIIPPGVTKIGNDAFSGCTSLTTIIIPPGVIKIGAHAFEGCTSLTTITFPPGVTKIGTGAFERCTSLMTITIPPSVTKIDIFELLDYEKLTSIVIDTSDNHEYAQIMNLLPDQLRDKVLTIPEQQRIKEIQKESVDKLLNAPNMNPLYDKQSRADRGNLRFFPDILPADIFTHLNRFMSDLPAFQQAQNQIMAAPITRKHNNEIDFDGYQTMLMEIVASYQSSTPSPRKFK